MKKDDASGSTPQRRESSGPDAGRTTERRLYDITCSACGAPDSVPFKPKPGRTVLCRACLSSREDRRELTEVQCARCGASTSVPFKPRPGREVLCRPCLDESKREEPGGPRREPRADGERPRRDAPRRDRDGAPASYEVACSHCGKTDTVPFKPYPGSAVLCRDCMGNPNVARVGGRIVHSIICSSCGEVDRVPFKPDSGSRVLCRACHVNEREEKRRARERHADRHPKEVHGTKVRIDVRCDRCGSEDSLPFVPRTSGPILCRQCAQATFGEEWALRHRVGRARDYPFTCSRCSRTDFVPFRPKPGRDLLCKRCLDDQAIPNPERLAGREKMSPFLYVKRREESEDE